MRVKQTRYQIPPFWAFAWLNAPLSWLIDRTAEESHPPCPSTLRRRNQKAEFVPDSLPLHKLKRLAQSQESKPRDRQLPKCRPQSKARTCGPSLRPPRTRPPATSRQTARHRG